MGSNCERAVSLLTGDVTVALCRGDETLTSTERGIKPLIGFISEERDLRGYSAADRIVGKAAAMLYVLLGVSEVYAAVMSKAGLETLERHGIEAQYETLADVIVNRKGTGMCPMEETVKDIDSPPEALAALREKIRIMNMAK